MLPRAPHYTTLNHSPSATSPSLPWPTPTRNGNVLKIHRQDKTIVLPFKNGQNNILLQCKQGKEQQDHLYKLFHKVWAFEKASAFLR